MSSTLKKQMSDRVPSRAPAAGSLKGTQSDVIYVLSNPRIKGEYKVGKHQGSLKKLYSRYGTYIPDVKVHYFIQGIDAKSIENEFKGLRSDERISLQHSEGQSEWFKLPLHELIVDLFMLIVGQECGIKDKKKFRVTELLHSSEKGTRILTSKPPAPAVIDLTGDEDTSSDHEDEPTDTDFDDDK